MLLGHAELMVPRTGSQTDQELPVVTAAKQLKSSTRRLLALRMLNRNLLDVKKEFLTEFCSSSLTLIMGFLIDMLVGAQQYTALHICLWSSEWPTGADRFGSCDL
jgi:hypothetical protein